MVLHQGVSRGITGVLRSVSMSFRTRGLRGISGGFRRLVRESQGVSGNRVSPGHVLRSASKSRNDN